MTPPLDLSTDGIGEANARWPRRNIDSWTTAKAEVMHIALIDPSLFTLAYDRMLATGLQQAGHDVFLHTRALKVNETAGESITVVPDFYRVTRGARPIWLPNMLRLALKGADHIASMLRLLARLRQDPPDIIHFQWLPLPMVDRLFLPMLARIAPLVLTVHDSTPFNGNPATRLQRIGANAAFGDFARLIVHTNGFRERLIARGVSADRVVRIPHGLLGEIPDHGMDTCPKVDAIATALPRPTTFLLFGQIKPYKGVDVLIEAFARMPEALKAIARIRVVGQPHMGLAPLLDLAEARGIASRVSIEPRFVAEDEIPALFGPDSIAVFPYREIEASGALTLAIAHGRPVIASRIGSFSEELQDGVHGVTVPAEDPAALAVAMERLLTDEAFTARCAINVRKLSEAAPSWSEIGLKTAAVYASILSESRHPDQHHLVPPANPHAL